MRSVVEHYSPQRVANLDKAYHEISAVLDGGVPTTYELIVTFGRDIRGIAPSVTMYGPHALAKECPKPVSVPAEDLDHRG
jgi:hypothetical protein